MASVLHMETNLVCYFPTLPDHGALDQETRQPVETALPNYVEHARVGMYRAVKEDWFSLRKWTELVESDPLDCRQARGRGRHRCVRHGR